jgi:heme oxygenase
LDGFAGLVIYTSSIKKWEDGLEVDEADRAKIVDNIRRAFRFRNIEIEIACILI